MKLNNIIGKYIKIVLTISLLVFSYFYISLLIKEADFKSVEVNVYFVLLSVVLFILAYLLFSFNWLLSAKILRSKITKYQLLVFFASQPYKYLPTSLFIFSSRALFSKKLNLSLKHSSVAQLIENSVLFAANFSLFAVLYSYEINIYLSITILSMVASSLLLLRHKRILVINFNKHTLTVNSNNIIFMYLLSSMGWLIAGLAFVSLNVSLGLNFDLVNLIMANTIAFSLSMLAFFAPGGIGIRELVYNNFDVNTQSIIYWRIIVFFIDFLVGIPSIFAIKYLERNFHKNT